MSDTPLFQNRDEQEALYAPQQLPSDDATDDDIGVGYVPIPALGGVNTPAGPPTVAPTGERGATPISEDDTRPVS